MYRSKMYPELQERYRKQREDKRDLIISITLASLVALGIVAELIRYFVFIKPTL